MPEPAKPAPVDPPAPIDPPSPEPAPEPAAPPAAKAVVNGKTEREIELEKKLEDAESGRKKAEIVAAEKEDQLSQLKKLQTDPPKNKDKKERVRLTFFDGEED
jgi:hypothetical protein